MIEDVLNFWFAEGMDKKWFFKDPAFDKEVEKRLLPLYDKASRGELKDWENSVQGCLALCILLDQVPRNMFRNDPKTFATDTVALNVAQIVVDKGWDKSLSEQERVFLYLPFEHSEELSHQEKSLELYRELGEKSDWYVYAEKHEVIVRRFGRFPHRNEVLGRESTPEEIEFLKQPGSSF
ncbi:DUF924 family protein [Kiloniella sp.]|uniref:DUF924 family protein n=1 Tax=Kiloniella sp. TaxID=1938587 RepID=UPI003B027B7D